MPKDVIATKLEQLINAVAADDPIDFEPRRIEVIKSGDHYEADVDSAGIALQYMVRTHLYLESAGLVDNSKNPQYENCQIITDAGRYHPGSTTGSVVQMSDHIYAKSSQGEVEAKVFTNAAGIMEAQPYQGNEGGEETKAISLHPRNLILEVGFGTRNEAEISRRLDAALRLHQNDPKAKNPWKR